MILQTNWFSSQQPKEGQVREEKELPIVSCTAWGYWAESIQEPQAIIEDCKDKNGGKSCGASKVRGSGGPQFTPEILHRK